jgi:pyruvate-formate lyase
MLLIEVKGDVMTMIQNRWQAVLEHNRENNFRQKKFDVGLIWRALVFREHAGEPEVMVRAWAFKNVLDHLEFEVDEGLLVGSCRSLTSDTWPAGSSTNQQDLVSDYPALVAEHQARGQRDFWAGFDHSLADYPTLLTIGVGGYRQRVRESLAQHSEAGSPEVGSPDAKAQTFLKAVDLTLEAFSGFIRRAGEAVNRAGRADIAEACAAVVEDAPRCLREAVQLVWLVHLAFKTEGRCHMALGRIDQYLLPFYELDCQEGRLTREEALDLLCHLWARLDEVGEVQNICIGGLTLEGEDATNELSYLCLEATRLIQSPHTNLSARFHDGTPETFHRACFEVIRTGIGFPAIFNDHVLLAGLAEIGIPAAAARDYCMVGCIETMLPGRQPAWSDSRFNTPLYLLSAMEQLAAVPQPDYEQLEALFRAELACAIREHAATVNAYIARFPPERFPDPFLSAFTRDCIGRARDINDGGAEFARFHGIAVMGLATLADSLAAVKKLVFEERRVAFADLLAALKADFAGAEALRQVLMNKAPKYGNDDPYVDEIAAQIVEWTAEECLKHEVVGGGRFVSAMAANVQNISAGREVGATPDGRRAFTPLSDAASPYFGRDLRGPTAFLRSVAVPDYHKVLTGSVINMRFDPDHFNDEEGAGRFLAFTRFFVVGRIPELQFNFSKDDVLLAARREPEKYRNLVVRVSGFSARFVELDPEVQDDILRRRPHR